jgi:predicted RecB family nuclease
LRALAIREKKIHVVDLLALQLDGTPVYLDVEGLPDRDFYYLIGIRVGTGDHAVQYAFWADDETAEKRIWNEFLDVILTIPNPRVIHFGSYETVFLRRMSRRHGQPREGSTVSLAIERAVNLLSFVRLLGMQHQLAGRKTVGKRHGLYISARFGRDLSLL